jgi:hypothetical protein
MSASTKRIEGVWYEGCGCVGSQVDAMVDGICY